MLTGKFVNVVLLLSKNFWLLCPLLMAAKKEALRIRAIENQIHHTRQSNWCMLCKEAQ